MAQVAPGLLGDLLMVAGGLAMGLSFPFLRDADSPLPKAPSLCFGFLRALLRFAAATGTALLCGAFMSQLMPLPFVTPLLPLAILILAIVLGLVAAADPGTRLEYSLLRLAAATVCCLRVFELARRGREVAPEFLYAALAGLGPLCSTSYGAPASEEDRALARDGPTLTTLLRALGTMWTFGLYFSIPAAAPVHLAVSLDP
jgi:hypothetical protein